MLATSISGCSSATGALARRPILPSNSAWQSACPKKCIRCAGREEWRLSAQETFSRGGARKKDGWRVQKMRVGALVQQPLSRFAMAQEWRVVARGVHGERVCGARALTHSHTHPFAGCMAGREGIGKARGLNADGPAVAALPSWGSPCRRTHPQPSHHVAGGWVVRVGVCSVLDLL